ncbi:MAG: glycine zipper domain-containing protein [Candidatus Berkiellales bacterium]
MKVVTTLVSAATLLFLVGCTNMAPEEQGVLSGSALGALGGAAMGSLSGNAGPGALIGAALGGIGGSMVASNERARDMRGRYYRDDRRFAPPPRYRGRFEDRYYEDYDDGDYTVDEYYYERGHYR